MKKYALLILPLLSTQDLFAAPLSAIMTFESMTITADGVKKQTYFQEQFVRDNNVVWSERIIPKNTANHEENIGSEEHEHNLNFATAGKWLVRDSSNQIKFRFVRENEKKIIEPRTSEYGTLGFDGVWETAFYLINRDALKTMTAIKKTAPQQSVWYEKKTSTQFTRILWDNLNQIPLSIESGNLDGSINNKITLALKPTPTKLPWAGLNSFQTIAYEDLLD
jgi:hypothetical protein